MHSLRGETHINVEYINLIWSILKTTVLNGIVNLQVMNMVICSRVTSCITYAPFRQGLPLVCDQLATDFYMSSLYDHDLMVLIGATNVHNSPLIFWRHQSSAMQNQSPTGFWMCLKTWWRPIFHWQSHNYSRTPSLKKVTL